MVTRATFAPGQTELYRGVYRVTVEGLTTLDGDAAMLDYEIRFVDMAENDCDRKGLPSEGSSPLFLFTAPAEEALYLPRPVRF